jgi:ATP-binding protein involved in chromosome partitioning
MAVTPDQILESLRGVAFEDHAKDVVALGLVKDPRADGGRVSLTLEMPSPGHPAAEETAARIRAALADLDGVETVDVRSTWSVPETEFSKPKVPGVREVLVIASGKGGVGKSTVATNLAVGLARLGARVGLGDLDIYGPSVPTALGSSEQPSVSADKRIVPPESHGVRFLSMGQMAGAGKAVMWRGPMLHQMVGQIVQADWGELDYLVLDLPPGTGDVQLTVVQTLPVTGAVIVTTPQEIALIDARKGLTMFRDNKIEILGIVENMAWFDCGKCSKRHWLFGRDGGAALAEKEGVPLLGRLPLDPEVRRRADTGSPLVLEDDEPGAEAARELAAATAARAGSLSLKRNPFRVLS